MFIRIKPGKAVTTNKMLTAWYITVLGFKPPGYKQRPYVNVNRLKLPLVFEALEAIKTDKFFRPSTLVR